MSSEMIVTFPGGKRVDTRIGAHEIRTDQPAAGGGQDSAPSPFQLFLAAIGTCAGIYVLGFCAQRGLPTAGIRIIERVIHSRQSGMVEKIDLEIQVPPAFPEKYRDSLIRSAELCAVKKHLERPPQFEIYTRTTDPVAA